MTGSDKHSSLLRTEKIKAVKIFMVQAPGVNIVKVFFFVTDSRSKYARVFVTLVFFRLAIYLRARPEPTQVEHFTVPHTMGRARKN